MPIECENSEVSNNRIDPLAQRKNLSEKPESGTLGSFSSYHGTQVLVNRLKLFGLPLDSITILGRGVDLGEQLHSKNDYEQAAPPPAASGGWPGAVIGLLVLVFSQNEGLVSSTASVLLGVGQGWCSE